MKFVAAFSNVSGKSSIHADGCRCATPRSGVTLEAVVAPDARKAAIRFAKSEDLVGRGYPKPTVAKCARGDA